MHRVYQFFREELVIPILQMSKLTLTKSYPAGKSGGGLGFDPEPFRLSSVSSELLVEALIGDNETLGREEIG